MSPMALHTRSDSLLTRQQILSAAIVVAIEGGPQALTIEAVAKEAKMSKGGVLYHFPSKDALVKGMLRFYLQGFWDALHRHWKADPRREGRWHRAWIRATFDSLRNDHKVENPALFSMIHSNPEHQQYLQRQFMRVQRCLNLDGLDSVQSRFLVSSIAGFRFDRMFRICWSEDVTLDAMETYCLRVLDGFSGKMGDPCGQAP